MMHNMKFISDKCARLLVASMDALFCLLFKLFQNEVVDLTRSLTIVLKWRDTYQEESFTCAYTAHSFLLQHHIRNK